jgi:hypothetical protein
MRARAVSIALVLALLAAAGIVLTACKGRGAQAIDA